MEVINKILSFANIMIVYMEILKESTKKKFLEPCDYSKVTGYKFNTEIVNHFLYISNEQVEFKIKNTITFILITSKIKYL